MKIQIPTAERIRDEATDQERCAVQTAPGHADPDDSCTRCGGDEFVCNDANPDLSRLCPKVGTGIAARWHEPPLVEFPSRVEVIRSNDGLNENGEVLTIFSGRFDPGKPVRLLIYMPGLNRFDGNGTIDGMLRQGFQDAIDEVKNSENTVVMLLEGPENPNRHQDWFAELGSFKTFLTQAQNGIERHYENIPLTFETDILVHSASGKIMSTIAERGEIDPRVNKIVFLDASYGSWAESLARSLQNSDTAFECVYNANDPETCGGVTALRDPSYEGAILTPMSADHMHVPTEYLKRVLGDE